MFDVRNDTYTSTNCELEMRRQRDDDACVRSDTKEVYAPYVKMSSAPYLFLSFLSIQIKSNGNIYKDSPPLENQTLKVYHYVQLPICQTIYQRHDRVLPYPSSYQ